MLWAGGVAPPAHGHARQGNMHDATFEQVITICSSIGAEHSRS
jgi:hypothetical protein